MVSKFGYLSPLIIIGKLTGKSNVSVSTIPGMIWNLSSLLFKTGTNKHEYPGGVLIINGFKILK